MCANVQNEVTKKVAGCDVAGTRLQQIADWVMSYDLWGERGYKTAGMGYDVAVTR